MTVDYSTYYEMKTAFVKKHNHDYKIETSPMNEYEIYYKRYTFEDGAVWYERMAPVWKTVEVETEVVTGVKVVLKDEIKLLETEFFNSDNATSFKYYEKY